MKELNISKLPDNPYLLLTPGPLSTTKSVKATMLRDWCTWDDDYNSIVQNIRARLVELAGAGHDCSAVLMQGSGTFCVESAIGSVIPESGKLLVIANGAYGERIAKIAACLKIDCAIYRPGETQAPNASSIESLLDSDSAITHVAAVHCETTTGMLNPVDVIGAAVKGRGRVFIVDAMSSFGGMPFSMDSINADFLVSSANKCIQGVPGFGFVIGKRAELEKCKGRARSLSLDLYDQWHTMESCGGKWRFTSPTHVVRAFAQALDELDDEGGTAARYARYSENHRRLVIGMRALGFECLLKDEFQSPIITSFHEPTNPDYSFNNFYHALKKRGFVIYPGKVTGADTFRIGNIGDIHPTDIDRLLDAVKQSQYWTTEESA